MIELDPLTALSTAGPVGVVCGWALLELRSWRIKIGDVMERNTAALVRLCDLIEDRREAPPPVVIAKMEGR